MKAMIKDLKKGDRFEFNNQIHTVRSKYSDWKRDGEPYMITESGVIYYFDELEVEKIVLLQ